MKINPKNTDKLISILKSKSLVLYGFGGAGSKIAKWCESNDIDFIFADKNANTKQKETERKIILPEQLKIQNINSNIVITSIIYYDEIFEQLMKLGFSREQLLSYRLFMPDDITWKDLECTTIWGTNEERMQIIADSICYDAKTVSDYGAGKLILKKFLKSTMKYYPIDYISRSDDTIICDFNYDPFPEIHTDVCICISTLVFINTAERLLQHLCTYTSKTIILSYVTLDTLSNIDSRRASGYASDLTEKQIINLLFANGFVLNKKCKDPANKIDNLYFFIRRGDNR